MPFKTSSTPPASPRLPSTAAARTPADDGNFRVIVGLASRLQKADALTDEAELVDRVKRACATRQIAYGGTVVHRACAALMHAHRKTLGTPRAAASEPVAVGAPDEARTGTGALAVVAGLREPAPIAAAGGARPAPGRPSPAAKNSPGIRRRAAASDAGDRPLVSAPLLDNPPVPAADDTAKENPMTDLLTETKARLGLTTPRPTTEPEPEPDPVVVAATRLLAAQSFPTRDALVAAVVALGFPATSDTVVAVHAVWPSRVFQRAGP